MVKPKASPKSTQMPHNEPEMPHNEPETYTGYSQACGHDIPRELVTYARTNMGQLRCETIFKMDKYIENIRITDCVENGIFEYCLYYVTINNFKKLFLIPTYEHKVSTLIKSFEINPELIVDLKSDMIKPHTIAFMTPSQIAPKKWDTLLAKKHLQEEKNNNLPTTDMYKCHKCDQRKCTVSFLQTRSIDEPMTIFVRCCNCYNMWTI